MMIKDTDRILSPDEVNALFSSLREDQNSVSQESAGRTPRKISKYDVRKPDRISKDQIRSLHLIHGNFQRSFTSSLSAYLRDFVEIRLLSIEQINYAEFLEYVSEPTCYNSIDLSPLDGSLVMDISYSAVFPMIDILLGGTGASSKQDRLLTDIEWSIIGGVIHVALRELREAWRPIIDLDMKVTAHESKPQQLQFVSLSESVVAVSFELKIGDCSGRLSLGIPSIVLKLLGKHFEKQKFATRRKEDGTKESTRVRQIVESLSVEMRAEIRNESIHVREFLELQTGDVIALKHRIEKPVLMTVGGIARFQGHMVKLGDIRGLVVEDQAAEVETLRDHAPSR